MEGLVQLTSEAPSRYNHLELMETGEILRAMNSEDKTVPLAVERCSKKGFSAKRGADLCFSPSDREDR